MHIAKKLNSITILKLTHNYKLNLKVNFKKLYKL